MEVMVPLHHAASEGDKEAVELLIDSGADVNARCTDADDIHDGNTPLHFAAHGHFGCISHLLAAGADPNISNSAGQTPLYSTVLWSFVEEFEALLDGGCDPLHRDNDGHTALQFADERIMNDEDPDPISPSIITALVAAGDRSWECVPTPCPGLEVAMLSVWQAAPDEMPELLKRLENPPQNLIELVPRMSEEMKKVVQEVLRVLHHHFAGFPHLKEHLLNSIFGFTTSV